MSRATGAPIAPRRWRARRWLLLVVALGLAARVGRVALGFPIWGDEAFVACNFLSRDLRGLLQPLEFGMVVPPGWLAPTHALSRLLGAEPWVLRLPALAAGCAALLLFVPFARRAVGRTAGLAAAALFAASYYLVRHSGEVKPYTFDLLAGLLVTMSAWPLVARAGGAEPGPRTGAPAGSSPATTPSTMDWLVFTALSAVAVWCSYPAIFVACGALLVLGGVVLRAPRHGEPRVPPGGAVILERSSPLPWLLASAAIAASFLAMYLLVGRHQQWSEERIADARHWDDHFPPHAQPWLWPWWLLRELTGNMLAYPNGGPNFGSSATFLLVVAGAVDCWRRGRRRELLLLASPLLPMLVAAALRKYPFGGSARTTLHLAVPVCLLAASGLVALLRSGRGWRRARVAVRGARIAAAGLALWVTVTIVTDCVRPWKGVGDVKNREALAWLRDQSRPGDRWVLFGRFAGFNRVHRSGSSEPLRSTAPPSWPGAPDLATWRGSAGRLRYYLLLFAREAGASIEWAPPPEALLAAAAGSDAATSGSTWVLAYRDNESRFPEAEWSAWSAAIERQFGEPSVTRRFVLGSASRDPDSGAEREESLTCLRFDARR